MLDNFAKENWIIDTNNLIQPTRKSIDFFYQLEPESECAKKLSQKQLKRIFGEPHAINKRTRTWFYYSTFGYESGPGSESIPPVGAQYFSFSFDPKGNLIRLASGGSSRDF